DGGSFMADELSALDATAQADLVRKHQASPAELVDHAIAAIERVNPQINAVIIPLFEKARAQAQGRSLPDGPFRGVPILLKDLICGTQGDPLYNGMRLLKEMAFVASHDSYLATKFRAAGFICIGRTNTPELGLNGTTEPEAFGPTRNPWDLQRSSGGSSGGSAAAVTARMVSVGHGGDGGGSIRVPASECGLVGLKPSRGYVSWGPELGDCWHGFATQGVMTRSVRDTAGVLDAIAGNMPGDPYAAPARARPFLLEVSASPGALRIGLIKQRPVSSTSLHPDCVEAVEHTARLLESLGHHVEESYPAALDDAGLIEHVTTIVASDTAATLVQMGTSLGRKVTPKDVEPATWQIATTGFALSAEQYLNAVSWVHSWSRRMASWWDSGFDLLLTPTIAEPPVLLGTFTGTPEDALSGFRRALQMACFTPAYNATGQPAISLPLHWNGAGQPIGIQLVAAFGRDDLLIRIAGQLEQAQPWAQRRPPICA